MNYLFTELLVYFAVDRRRFLAIAGGLIPNACLWSTEPKEPLPIAEASKYAKVSERWSADHLYDFLNALPDEQRLMCMKSLELLKDTDTVNDLKGKSVDVRQIQRALASVSTHTVERPFVDSAKLKYHDVVRWLGEKAELSKSVLEVDSTFAIEFAILRHFFAELWESGKLDQEKRAVILDLIDPDKKLKDRATLATVGGRSLFAALMLSEGLGGFAFYTGMSSAICTMAGWMGVTLPFAAYTSASSLVAFLCGPVGWAILALATAATVALAGRANRKKTAAFVVQIHLLRVAALKAAGVQESQIFTPSIRFPGGGRIEVNREEAREWETFEIVRNTDKTCSLSAYTGYLCAEGGGGTKAIANRDSIGDWEKWELIEHEGGKVSFKTKAKGKFLCATDDNKLTADRDEVGEWERFTLERAPDAKKVYIKCWNGKYLSAQPE